MYKRHQSLTCPSVLPYSDYSVPLTSHPQPIHLPTHTYTLPITLPTPFFLHTHIHLSYDSLILRLQCSHPTSPIPHSSPTLPIDLGTLLNPVLPHTLTCSLFLPAPLRSSLYKAKRAYRTLARLVFSSIVCLPSSVNTIHHNKKKNTYNKKKNPGERRLRYS
jgi:hypothetical protein